MSPKLVKERWHTNAVLPHKPGKSVELRFGRKFARISLNGFYRSSKSKAQTTKRYNPGWFFGFENYHIEWTHFKRHCWHIELLWRGCRGITLSYGKRV